VCGDAGDGRNKSSISAVKSGEQQWGGSTAILRMLQPWDVSRTAYISVHRALACLPCQYRTVLPFDMVSV
jgi:hypothetical protein